MSIPEKPSHPLAARDCSCQVDSPYQLYVGVSENSVSLNPMVFMIIIPIKWLFHWEYTLFSDKPMCASAN